MPHFPKPFFKKARSVWYVEIDRRQINLGPDKDAAFEQYHKLMSRPRDAVISTRSLAAIIDAFLDWTHRNRAPDTYEWYRYRLQRFVDHHPTLNVDQLRPYHAENWASSYPYRSRLDGIIYARSNGASSGPNAKGTSTPIRSRIWKSLRVKAVRS